MTPPAGPTPTTEAEFHAALRSLIERSAAAGVDVEDGWGFRTNDHGYSVEINALGPARNGVDGGARSAPTGSAAALDDAFLALSHPLRRRLLAGLFATPARERGARSLADLPGDEAERGASLRETHLPLLASLGYLAWDPETDAIGPGPRFSEVATVIELLAENQSQLPGGWP
ncbi:MAG: hypothetical protein ABEJ31_06775 [Haloarculaceae archaeon]